MVFDYQGQMMDGLYYFYAGWNGKCQYTLEKINRIANSIPDLDIYKVNTICLRLCFSATLPWIKKAIFSKTDKTVAIPQVHFQQ